MENTGSLTGSSTRNLGSVEQQLKRTWAPASCSLLRLLPYPQDFAKPIWITPAHSLRGFGYQLGLPGTPTAMANCHAGSNILYQPLEATYSLVQPCCRHRRGLCTGVTLVPKDRLDSRDRLILVQVKVKRAEKHLRGLAAEILALEHTTILTPDPNTGAAPHPISLLHPNNFQKAPTLSFDTVAIAGDVIHNLRSALDHLAQQLVAVGMDCAPVIPLTPEELRQIEFPIAETPKKYEAGKARKTKRMLPEAIEAIDELKPYKGGNDALWRIHELDNIDKHRALFTLAHDFLFTADWLPGAYLLKAENPLFAGVEVQVEQEIQLEIEKAVLPTSLGGRSMGGKIGEI